MDLAEHFALLVDPSLDAVLLGEFEELKDRLDYLVDLLAGDSIFRQTCKDTVGRQADAVHQTVSSILQLSQNRVVMFFVEQICEVILSLSHVA